MEMNKLDRKSLKKEMDRQSTIFLGYFSGMTINFIISVGVMTVANVSPAIIIGAIIYILASTVYIHFNNLLADRLLNEKYPTPNGFALLESVFKTSLISPVSVFVLMLLILFSKLNIIEPSIVTDFRQSVFLRKSIRDGAIKTV